MSIVSFTIMATGKDKSLENKTHSSNLSIRATEVDGFCPSEYGRKAITGKDITKELFSPSYRTVDGAIILIEIVDIYARSDKTGNPTNLVFVFRAKTNETCSCAFHSADKDYRAVVKGAERIMAKGSGNPSFDEVDEWLNDLALKPYADRILLGASTSPVYKAGCSLVAKALVPIKKEIVTEKPVNLKSRDSDDVRNPEALPDLPPEYKWVSEMGGVLFVTEKSSEARYFLDVLAKVANTLPKTWSILFREQAARLRALASAMDVIAQIVDMNDKP